MRKEVRKVVALTALAVDSRPGLDALAFKRATNDGTARTAVQTRVSLAQIVVDLAVDARSVGRTQTVEATVESRFANLVGRARTRCAIS